MQKLLPHAYFCRSRPNYAIFRIRIGGISLIWDRIALTLTIVGALNWGSIALFGLDLVAFLLGGQMALLSRMVYGLVGLAGLWCITLLFRPREETGGAPHTA
jgi:uncharacterized membrane protein YuzA (DUF378 family)